MPEPWESIKEPLQKLVAGRDLTANEAAAALGAVLGGDSTTVQVGALLALLRAKGHAAAELAGFSLKLAERMPPIDLGVRPEGLVDLGGAGLERQVVSPVLGGAAIVAAAAGVKIVASVSRGGPDGFGSADIFALLGVGVGAPLEAHRRCMHDIGIALVQPRVASPFLAQLEPLRHELGFRTLLDEAAAIVSPYGAKRLVIGVSSEAALDSVVAAIRRVGAQHAIVCQAQDGLDEISVVGKTKLVDVAGGQPDSLYVQPESLGLKKHPAGAVVARNAEEGALALNGVFQGQAGPVRDAVVLNAAAAIRVGGFASSYEKAVEVAKRCVSSGRPNELLERLVRLTVA
jgi:anthranilate phosphoribosyltransferase